MKKWLIFGIGGSMGSRRCRNLQELGYTDIVGYDMNTESAKKAVKKYNIQYVEKLKDLCNYKFDAAIISVPPLQKQKYIDLSNRFNVPCFIEADVTEYTGNYYSSATLRHHPAIQKIKELLDTGALGKVYTFTYHLGQSIYDWHPGCDMKAYYAAQKESGACREMFCFEIAWMSYLLGSPIDAKGLIDKKLGDPDITADDVYAASVEFYNKKQAVWVEPINENNTLFKALNSNTVTGTVLIDIISRPAIRELRIVGEKCNLLWNWKDSYISLEHPDGAVITYGYERGKAADGYNANICEDMYVAEMKNFIDAIQGKAKYLYTREDEKAVMGILGKVEGK
jgi:predicted dehydrogenase